VGPVAYALRVRPGRTVAGDLFDIMDLGDGRVGVSIGDVTGESIGAGILMAGTQAYLHGALVRLRDPAAALAEVNRYLTSRSAMNMFITMWVGVIDPATRTLKYVDAGHGHWLVKPTGGGGSARTPPRPGGIPVAIDASYHYQPETMPLGPGD